MKKNIKNYYPGQGCQCFACEECECSCGVDWTPIEIYKLKNLLQEAVDFYILPTLPSKKWWAEVGKLGIKRYKKQN